MKKYLVIADTYLRAYGAEYTLFGIFDTKEEAVQFILNYQPTDDFDQFDFFAGFEEGKGEVHYRRHGEKWYVPVTKEAYALRYIEEFDGKPLYIGGYQE